MKFTALGKLSSKTYFKNFNLFISPTWFFTLMLSQTLLTGRLAFSDEGKVVGFKNRMCHIDSDGSLFCTGNHFIPNEYVQPSKNSHEDFHVKEVALSDAQDCVVTTDGTLKCWSKNGEIDLSAAIGENTLEGFSLSVDGSYGCGVDRNGFLPLGTCIRFRKNLPYETEVPRKYGFGIVDQVAVNQNHVCGITPNRTASCARFNNSYDEIPFSLFALFTPEKAPKNLEKIRGSGGNLFCATLKTTGALCWKYNPLRGLNSTVFFSPLSDEYHYKKLSLTWGLVCGIRDSGEVDCAQTDTAQSNLKIYKPESRHLAGQFLDLAVSRDTIFLLKNDQSNIESVPLFTNHEDFIFVLPVADDFMNTR